MFGWTMNVIDWLINVLIDWSGMNYSAAGFEVVLTRKMSFYIITYYLPSGLLVVVSWIRYSVHRTASQGRTQGGGAGGGHAPPWTILDFQCYKSLRERAPQK